MSTVTSTTPSTTPIQTELNINSRRRKHIVDCAAKARKMSIDQVMSKTQTAARAFTEKLKALWPVLQSRILEGESSGSWACNEINTLLTPDLPCCISFTVSRINSRDIHPADIGRIPAGQTIELYISCITQYINVLAMEILYYMLKAAELSPMVNIFKYKPFNLADEILAELTDAQNNTIKYSDLAVSYIMGVNEIQEPVANLIIQAPGDQLEKKIIKFESGGERVLIWCKFDIARLLINIIGEHALVNYIGFIEFVPQDDIPSDTEFYEMINIREAIEQCDGIARVIMCHGCGRHELQGTQQQCGRCHKVRYCCVACQAVHWPDHKKYCVA
jgi:hypothetical protein